MSGRTASHAVFTAASGSFPGTSTRAIRESPSGVRITALPRVSIHQPPGATNLAPSGVVRGVSAASCSRAAGCAPGALFAVGSWPARIEAEGMSAERNRRKTRCLRMVRDRKSTRLNSSHLVISYAVFCLKKKRKKINNTTNNQKEHILEKELRDEKGRQTQTNRRGDQRPEHTTATRDTTRLRRRPVNADT